MAERNLYTCSDGRWAWRLKSDNGQIVATDGGQGYENESDARAVADAVVGGDYADARRTITRPK